LALVPAALWSGAISPIITERNTSQVFEASTYVSSNASALFDIPKVYTYRELVHGQYLNDKGLFATDPVALKGLILDSATSASATKNPGSSHQKLDKTNY
jgi:hypothetical protein